MHDASITIRGSAYQQGVRWAVDVTLSFDVENPFTVELIFANVTDADATLWTLPLRMFMEGTYLRKVARATEDADNEAFLTPVTGSLRAGLRGPVPAQLLGEETMILALIGECPVCGAHPEATSVFLDYDPLRVFCDRVNDAIGQLSTAMVP